MVIYNNNGYGVIVYQERFLTAEELANSIPVTEEELAGMDNTKVLRTDGVTWWYEDFPDPIPEPTPEPTLEERVSNLESENDLQDETIIALYEDNLTLTEQMASQTSINDGQDASIIEIYELLLNA